MQIDNVRISED